MGRRKNSHKRLFPAKYAASYVRTSRMDSTKAAAYNATRTPSTSGTGNNVEPRFNSGYMQKVPKTKHLSIRYVDETGKKVYIPTPRLEALHAKARQEPPSITEIRYARGSIWERWDGVVRHQGVKEFYVRVLQSKGALKVLLVFSGELAFVAQEDDEDQFISAEYTVQEAEERWHSDTINWVKHNKFKNKT